MRSLPNPFTVGTMTRKLRASWLAVALLGMGALSACSTDSDSHDAGSSAASTVTTTAQTSAQASGSDGSAPSTSGSDGSAPSTVNNAKDSSVTDSPVSAPPTPTNAGISPLGTADPAAKTQHPQPSTSLVVKNVRLGSHNGFDRVVFDLEGEGEPGWWIDYAETPTHQASGKAVNYHGSVALNVNIDGTTFVGEDPIAKTYPGTGNVTEVIGVGLFEGRTQYIIGLKSGRTPYSVQTLENPKRLVIDILQSQGN